MKRCTNCLFPETYETIVFDEKGICNVCHGQEYKHEKIDWEKRKQELKEIIDQYRGKGDYDCIIPFSGGKDSTFMAYYLMKEFNVKPLLVCVDHGFFRPKVLKLRIQTLKKLGVDFHLITPNYKVIKKLMLESLVRKGDFCWHCHTGIFAYPMQIAVKHNIPLIIWGEPAAEYNAYFSYENPEEMDEKSFNRYVNLGITAEDMVGFLGESVTMRDLSIYRYPSLKDLRKINYRSITLGSYIPWDTRKHSELIKKELGWDGDEVEGVPPEYFYEKVECMLNGVRDWCKFIKRGYGRTTHLGTLDIWNKRKTRDEAVKLVEEYDGKRPASVDYFLEFMGMTEKEFMEIILQHQISPHKFDQHKIIPGKKLPDSDSWDRTKVE